MKQKRCNHEFEQTVVELYSSGQAVNDLAREYGVSEVTIHKWIKLLFTYRRKRRFNGIRGICHPKGKSEIKTGD